MLQHSAELEMQHRFRLQHENRMQELEFNKARNCGDRSIGYFMLIYLLVLFAVVGFVVTRANDNPQNTSTVRTDSIVNTLHKIQNMDTNNDGLINCIDYALQFYDLYPDKSNIRLVWNKNKPGMNHLFIKVNGIAVEPASYINPSEDFFRMDKSYPTVYNPVYDRDITNSIDNVRNNNYRWIW
jgi:hypothetical protein